MRHFKEDWSLICPLLKSDCIHVIGETWMCLLTPDLWLSVMRLGFETSTLE